MKKITIAVVVSFLVVSMQLSFAADLKPGEQITEKSRCPVCGMFVAKYEQWLAQLHMSDGSILTFDGVKDMMAYYYSPQQFGGAEGISVSEVYIKDYYEQKWSDGRTAVYVTGSDVYGPMGHEFIPFVERAGAENFMKDHHGKQIYAFSEITPEIVESLRKGHKMKGMKKME